MGTFWRVEHKANCIACGVPLHDFQSKSGNGYPDCSTVSSLEVCDFYTKCGACGQWHDFEVIPTAVEIRCVSVPRVDRGE